MVGIISSRRNNRVNRNRKRSGVLGSRTSILNNVPGKCLQVLANA